MGGELDPAEAVGLSPEEVLDERHVLPGTRFAVHARVTFARTGPWGDAVASGVTERRASRSRRTARWSRSAKSGG